MKTITISLSFKDKKSLLVCLGKLYPHFRCYLSIYKYEIGLSLEKLDNAMQVSEIKRIVKTLKTKPIKFIVSTTICEYYRDEVIL